MDALYFLTALSIGFLGSFHCIGMCGPIAIALPASKEGTLHLIMGRMMYNAGRIVTYSIFGLIAGIAGFSISAQGFQRDFSALAGVIILVTVIATSGSRHIPKLNHRLSALSLPLKKKFSYLYGKGTYLSLFAIGLLNGLLPCGFVYLALAGAVAGGTISSGILYMIMFGIGTFPAMMVVSVSGQMLGTSVKRNINRFSPVIAIAVGLLLIYRGTDMKTDDCCKEHTACSTTK